MTKRYVYWRNPNGQPYKQDDGKYAPNAVLAQIGESATVTAEGGISWPLSGLRQNDFAIHAAITILDPDNEELDELNTSAIIHRAVNAEIKRVGGGKPLQHQAFLKSADQQAAIYYRQPKTEHIVATSLSVKTFPHRQITVNGCGIKPVANRIAAFPPPPQISDGISDRRFHGHLKATEYQAVSITVAERGPAAAVDMALGTLNLLRGLWTLFATYGSWQMSFGNSTPKPVGVIHLGPVHTLHRADGSPLDNYWYEPEYEGDRKAFEPKSGWDKLDKARIWAMKRLAKLKHRHEIERLVIRYANALDHSNLDVAFLQMWSILEKITDTVGAKYDETIERATWGFQDRQVARDLLGSLRFRRNQYVHAAKSSDEREQVIYMIKSFVDPHLMKLIANHGRVSSIAEYAEFHSLPTNITILKDRRQFLHRAERMLSKLAAKRQNASKRRTIELKPKTDPAS